VLSLQENIGIGQRVEKFVFEYKDGEEWKLIAEGSTIGYKRLLKFNAVTAKQVRLRILSSRLNPTLSAFGLYKLAE
jgi:alpha-L-fucosidase